jgi:hypothetical protein
MCSSGSFQFQSDKIWLEGYLEKESRWLKIWRKRWCVLTSTGLYAYRAEGDIKNSTESVLLDDFSSVKTTFQGEKRKHVIRIETPQRTLLLSARSEMEMHKWMNAIQDCRLPKLFEDGCHSIRLKQWGQLSRYAIPEYEDEMSDDADDDIQVFKPRRSGTTRKDDRNERKNSNDFNKIQLKWPALLFEV